MEKSEKYLGYSSIDLLNDDSFMKWVRKDDPKAILFWDQLIKENTQFQKQVNEAVEIYNYFITHEEKLSLDETFQIWDNINSGFVKRRNNIFLSILKYAAIFVLVFSLGAVCYYLYQDFNRQEFTLSDNNIIGEDEAVIVLADGRKVPLNKKESEIKYDINGDQLIVNNDTISQSISNDEIEKVNRVVIPYGKKSMITLSDGTKVWLNAGSQLVYPIRFIRKKREVFLIGEAYFEVTHNEKNPFIVRTNEINVEVLGTTFDISTYPEDQFVETILIEGSVSLEIKKEGILEAQENVILSPNQRATFYKGNGDIKLESVDASLFTSWTKGMLKNEKEDLCRVIQKLERYYNININIKDPELGYYKISGKLDLKSKPEEVLNVIQSTVPIDWGKQNNGDFFIVEPI